MNPSDEVLVKWFEARDTFIGCNYRMRDYARGLELAKRVKDEIPEAKWLCDLFPDGSVGARGSPDVFARLVSCVKPDRDYAKAYLSVLSKGDVALARELEIHVTEDENPTHPLLLSALLENVESTEARRQIAEKLAENREPKGFYELWVLSRNRNVAHLKRAADLGLVVAWQEYGVYLSGFGELRPESYAWRGRAAQRGCVTGTYLGHVECVLFMFLAGPVPNASASIAEIEAVYGEGLLSNDCLFLQSSVRNNPFAVMLYIRDLCKNWRADARRAVNAWLGVGRRLRVVKDIRGVIGKRVWNEWLRDVEYTPVVPDANPIIYRERCEDPVAECSMHCRFSAEKKMNPSDEELVKWYDARDAFLGRNYTLQSYTRGLELAHALSAETKAAIPEATWLCNLFPDADVMAGEVFYVLAKEFETSSMSATAAAYLAYLSRNPLPEWTRVAKSARHPLHVASFAFGRDDTREFEKLASLREPYGFWVLWQTDGNMDNLQRAAELGLVDAWLEMGKVIVKGPQKFHWLGKAAQRGLRVDEFVTAAYIELVWFLGGNSETTACIAQIGEMIGHGGLEFEDGSMTRRLDNYTHTPDMYVHVMYYVRDLCKQWKKDARDALNAWSCVGLRRRVVKDIRLMIGKRIIEEWTRDVEYCPFRPDGVPRGPIAKCFMVRSSSI